MTPQPGPARPGGASLTLERTYKATPELLFRAWTDPALATRWLSPGNKTCAMPVYEARKGGRFRIEMTGPDPDGQVRTYVSEGVFEEVTPPLRLVMTWQLVAPVWSPDGKPDPPTLVTVTFTRVPEGTLLRLVHERLPDEEHAKGARMGWAMALDKLPAVLGG